MKLIINYDPLSYYDSCGDGCAKKILEQLFEDWKDDVYEHDTSTANIIDEVRLAVAEDRIKPEDVEIRFKDQVLTINEYGVLSSYPDGFCDHHIKIAEQILRTAIAKKKLKSQ